MKRRAHILDAFKTRKKPRIAPSHDADWGDDHQSISAEDIPNDTKASLLLLRSLFNTKVFEDRVPAIIFKHQVYSIVNNKTLVDQQISEMRETKEIKLFRLGKEADEFCIVFTDNYKDHLRKQFTNSDIIAKFIDTVVMETTDVSLNKTKMVEFGFSDKDITHLLRGGALNVRDVGSWWLAVPGAGLFIKNLVKGRESLVRTIRKSKYKEMLQSELEARKLQAVKKLSMQYHMHDIIGAELVTKIQTTSGTLLRLVES
ncbi:inactive serine/threonine-protein kinase 19-like [Amphiura filiformis]|uniref:inactive serine/threonine-protein kinase 19-like n=1 Tax=Amphiura filiformis TaxID=82378 RepID=UPI003B21FCF9